MYWRFQDECHTKPEKGQESVFWKIKFWGWMMDSLPDVYFYCMPDMLLGKERVRGGTAKYRKEGMFSKDNMD